MCKRILLQDVYTCVIVQLVLEGYNRIGDGLWTTTVEARRARKDEVKAWHAIPAIVPPVLSPAS